MFDSLKIVAEKLSSCHMDIVHKLQELTKELAKYLEEQKAKHKQVKNCLKLQIFDFVKSFPISSDIPTKSKAIVIPSFGCCFFFFQCRLEPG